MCFVWVVMISETRGAFLRFFKFNFCRLFRDTSAVFASDCSCFMMVFCYIINSGAQRLTCRPHLFTTQTACCYELWLSVAVYYNLHFIHFFCNESMELWIFVHILMATCRD